MVVSFEPLVPEETVFPAKPELNFIHRIKTRSSFEIRQNLWSLKHYESL